MGDMHGYAMLFQRLFQSNGFEFFVMTLSPALTLISSAWFAVQDSVGIEIKRIFEEIS